MKKICVILVILIIASTTYTASAGLGDGAKEAISEGMDEFCISKADQIFSLSFSGFDDSAGTNSVGYIYNIASYTPNPFESSVVKQFTDYSKELFKSCYPIIILSAFIVMLVTHYKADSLQQFSQAMGIKLAGKSNILSKKAYDGIIIAIFMYIFIYFVLAINDYLTKSVMISILDVVSPSPDNLVLYCMMAIAYGVMWFFFSVRTLVIYLFCGFALIIGLGLLVDFTKEKATDICAYFTQAVFFQFIIVLYFSSCILIIKEITSPLDFDGQSVWYTVMIIGGVYLGIKMMFGTGVIRFAGRAASRLV